LYNSTQSCHNGTVVTSQARYYNRLLLVYNSIIARNNRFHSGSLYIAFIARGSVSDQERQ